IPSDRHTLDLHSFPTRRSSDLERMGARARYAVIALVAILPAAASAEAAELVIVTNQGATPGVRELAAAFSRASGHQLTVLQETRSEEHTSELQSLRHLVCRLLL